ncbi:hypothetical protein A2361_00180 [Candidatus Woesebacteria bacterium RIFOXYB1_FULL_40_26]|uniref:Uncharacterized protein n=2 Tax=Candidatus Woeseibacteriota TaxID=1752722 RepID=A0A1F8DHY9_9BACT|nr:MAG: hypothetical protein A2361_00180 [Candidatus Woesebacteria bacterium RIFOXYB1_FULL_40_26]OGM88224.1 MAG: hypothetical protein A2614_01335 [Candidatus Woesebacteria bacterium RIFOXYD1_FULL_40_21]
MAEIKRSVYLGKTDLFGQKPVLVKRGDGLNRTEEPTTVGTLSPDFHLVLTMRSKPYRKQITADVQALLTGNKP